jgi:hypothetical protein
MAGIWSKEIESALFPCLADKRIVVIFAGENMPADTGIESARKHLSLLGPARDENQPARIFDEGVDDAEVLLPGCIEFAAWFLADDTILLIDDIQYFVRCDRKPRSP